MVQKLPQTQALTTKVREAQKLFSSEEEAIAFAVDYGFDEVHVELLRVSGKVLESAEVLAKGGRIADAIKALIATPRAPGCARRAVEYLSTGLWKYQSFGVDPPTTDPEAVSELLTLGDTLRNDMHQAEAREVRSLFSYDVILTVRNSSKCSKQGTKAIFKPLEFCIPSLLKREISPLLCCALIRSSSPLSLYKVLPRSIPHPHFPSTFPTSSF